MIKPSIRTRPGLRCRSMRKVLLFTLLAWAGMALAGACGGTGLPPARLTFTLDRSGNSDITVPKAGDSGPVDLTSVLPWDAFPAWSPDGGRVAYYAPSPDERFTRDIYVADADGSEVVNLTDSPAEDALPSWSPDRGLMAFYSALDGNGEV